MKNMLVLFVVLNLSSVCAFATEKNVGKEAQEIVAALLSGNGAAKVAEFAKFADVVESVTINEMNDVTEYKISGVKLIGGDVPCGYGELTIKKSMAPQFGLGNLIPVYQAEVSGSSTCQ